MNGTKTNIDGLAAIVTGQSKRIDSLESTLQTFVSEVRIAIERIATRQAEGQKTQWPVLFGAMSIVIAIVSLGASGYVRDLGEIRSAHQLLADRQFAHYQSDGHPGVSRNRDMIARLVQVQDRAADHNRETLEKVWEVDHAAQRLIERVKALEEKAAGVTETRFSRQDYERLVRPLLMDLMDRVARIEAGREE